jgi:lipopolysaccharide export system permease protein
MTIIDRYVGKQILVTGGFAVAVLSLVLVLGNIFRQLLDLLVNHDVPIQYILAFIGYVLPFSLTFTIPWGFLTAVLLVFGKMSAENELVALRSHGVGVPRATVAVFAVAAACTAVCLWINVSVAPKAQEQMKNALFEIATNNPIAMFGSDEVIDEFPGRKIYVGAKDGNDLRNLLLFELSESDDPIRVAHAREGSIKTDLENKQVLLHLEEARFEQRDERQPGDIDKIRHGITMSEVVIPIALEELYEKNRRRRGLSQMTLDELLRSEQSGDRSAYRTEVSKRFSFSLASMAFALIGIPLAVTAHRKETSIGALLSLVVAFVYFFFIIIADNLRNDPRLFPEYLMWLPNVLFMAIGAFLFVRLARR